MRKRVFTVFIALLLVAALSACFVGCMKIGMKKNSVIERLEENGYVIVNSKPQIDFDENIMRTVDLNDAFYANSATQADENGNQSLFAVYLYYCADTDSADTLEKLIADENVLAELQEYLGKNCTIYRYDDIVVFGDVESVTIARNY